MSLIHSPTFMRALPCFTEQATPAEPHRIARLSRIERNILWPAKAIILAFLICQLWFSNGFVPMAPWQEALLNFFQSFFPFYLLVNLIVAIPCYTGLGRPLKWLSRMVITLLDGLLLGILTLFTGGSESVLFWGFVGLVVHHGVTMPAGPRQIILNGLVILCYIGAGQLHHVLCQWDTLPEKIPPALFTLPFTVNMLWLLLLTSAFALPFLLRQVQGFWRTLVRPSHPSAHEQAVRQIQWRMARQLTKATAQQLQNPLEIIHTTVLNLRQRVPADQAIATQQINILQEEAERLQRILHEMLNFTQRHESQDETRLFTTNGH